MTNTSINGKKGKNNKPDKDGFAKGRINNMKETWMACKVAWLYPEGSGKWLNIQMEIFGK